MGLVMELIVKPVAVPALRAEEKALLTVRVLVLLLQEQDKLLLKSESFRVHESPLEFTISYCRLLEASGFTFGNTI